MYFNKRYIVLIIFIAGLIACSQKLYIPAEQDAVKANIPLQQLNEGRQLYIDRCGSCHNLFLPGQFTKDKWIIELNDMKDRSNLTEDQKKMILNYLTLGK